MNRFRIAFVATVMVACLAISRATATDYFNAYAAPNVWGPKLTLRAHLGKATYTVSYKAVGKTQVIGQVTYWATKNKEVTKEFNGSITFTTADVVATPTVRFKGIPLGSAVKVTVSP
jgi:hypothetical protein